MQKKIKTLASKLKGSTHSFSSLINDKKKFIEMASLEELQAYLKDLSVLEPQEQFIKLFGLLYFFNEHEKYKEGKFIGDPRENLLFEKLIDLIKVNVTLLDKTTLNYFIKINKRYPRIVVEQELGLLKSFPSDSIHCLSNLSEENFSTLKNKWVEIVEKLKIFTSIRTSKPLEFPRTYSHLFIDLVTKGLNKKISFNTSELLSYCLPFVSSPDEFIAEINTSLVFLLLKSTEEDHQRHIIALLCSEPFNFDWTDQFYEDQNILDRLVSTKNEPLLVKIFEEQSKHTTTAISNVLTVVERFTYNHDKGQIKATPAGTFLFATMLRILLSHPEHFNLSLIEKFKRLISTYRPAFNDILTAIHRELVIFLDAFGSNPSAENYKNIWSFLFDKEKNYSYKFQTLKAICHNVFAGIPEDDDNLNAMLFYHYFTQNKKTFNVNFLLNIFASSQGENTSPLRPSAVIEVLVRNQVNHVLYDACLKMIHSLDPTKQWKKDKHSLFAALKWCDLRFIKEILSESEIASSERIDAALTYVINQLNNIITAPYLTKDAIKYHQEYFNILAFLCINPNPPSTYGVDTVLHYLLEDRDAQINLFSSHEAQRWEIAASLCTRAALSKPSRSTLDWVIDKALDYNQWSLIEQLYVIESDFQKSDTCYVRLDGNGLINKVCDKAVREKRWSFIKTILCQQINLDSEILSNVLDTAMLDEQWSIVNELLILIPTYPLEDYVLEEIIETANQEKQWYTMFLLYCSAPTLEAFILDKWIATEWKPLIEIVSCCKRDNEWLKLEQIFEAFRPVFELSTLETIFVALIDNEQHHFLEKMCNLYPLESSQSESVGQYNKKIIENQRMHEEKNNLSLEIPQLIDVPEKIKEELVENNLRQDAEAVSKANQEPSQLSTPAIKDSLQLQDELSRASTTDTGTEKNEFLTNVQRLDNDVASMKKLILGLDKDTKKDALPALESMINTDKYLPAADQLEEQKVSTPKNALASTQSSILNDRKSKKSMKAQYFLNHQAQTLITPLNSESTTLDVIAKSGQDLSSSEKRIDANAVLTSNQDSLLIKSLRSGGSNDNLQINKKNLSKQQLKRLKRKGGFFESQQPSVITEPTTKDVVHCPFTFEGKTVTLGTEEQLGQFSCKLNNCSKPFMVYYLTKDNAHNIDQNDVDCFKGKIDTATGEGFVPPKGNVGIKMIDDRGKMPIVSLKILGKQQSGKNTAGDFRLLGVMDAERGMIVFLRTTNHDNFNRDKNRLKSCIQYLAADTVDGNQPAKTKTISPKF